MRYSLSLLNFAVIAGLLSVINTGLAQTTPVQVPTNTKVALVRPDATPAPIGVQLPPPADAFVFSAPPTGSSAEDNAMYRAIADYLTAATGKHFTYRNPETWLTYSKEMSSGRYDLVFDGAPLNGWRLNRLQHKPLVRLAEDMTFATIVLNDNMKFTSIKQLGGQIICSQEPTNPEMLALLSQFDNPSRQPVLLNAKGWDHAVRGVITGKCAATVVPTKYLEAANRGPIRILEKHTALPGHAFSVSPRIPPEVQEKIRAALTSAEGKRVTAGLRALHGSEGFVDANPEAYAQMDKLLKNTGYHN